MNLTVDQKAADNTQLWTKLNNKLKESDKTYTWQKVYGSILQSSKMKRGFH